MTITEDDEFVDGIEIKNQEEPNAENNDNKELEFLIRAAIRKKSAAHAPDIRSILL